MITKIQKKLKFKGTSLMNFFLSKLKQSFGDVHCPICKNNYTQFETAGLVPRENAECPNCKSRERHRLIYLFLQKDNFFYKKKKNFNLLHIAPEECLFNKFKNLNFINYYPCDLNPENFNHLKGTKIQEANITDLPFVDNSFEFIMCNHVLEHIEEDRKALSELFRVMKPGGKGIFLVPINESLENTYEDFSIVSPLDREKAFGQVDHVRVCGKDYLNRYSEAGFRLIESSFGTNFSNKKRFKYGLLETERIFTWEK